jgi:hypothetical protein
MRLLVLMRCGVLRPEQRQVFRPWLVGEIRVRAARELSESAVPWTTSNGTPRAEPLKPMKAAISAPEKPGAARIRRSRRPL